MHHLKRHDDRHFGVQRRNRLRRRNVTTVLAALTLAFASVALSGCASDKPVGNVSTGRQRSVNPDRNLTATIVRVERSGYETLAEIDAGQRDGVKKDWVMTIGGEGGRFVGNLRIKYVDVNRATGVISLEQGPNAVKVGQKAYAIAGSVDIPACGGTTPEAANNTPSQVPTHGRGPPTTINRLPLFKAT